MESQASPRARFARLALLALVLGAAASASAETGRAPAFFDDFNGSGIDASAWQVATWREHGGQTGAERCFAKDGCLVMQYVNDGGALLSSAIQTRGSFLYGTWEYRAKCSSVPGVLNSFYAIDWRDGKGTRQEIDIEFLSRSFGKGGGRIHFAVHRAGRRSFQTDPDPELGFDPSAAFHTYAIDVARTSVRWLVDGRELRRYAYESGDICVDQPYQLKLNCWSQAAWIGGPPESGAVCSYLIDWIRFTPSE